MMPRMTGCEAAKAIRALPGRPDAAKIPIIAMTANAFAEDVQASLAAGMDAHLSKPFVIQNVLETISVRARFVLERYRKHLIDNKNHSHLQSRPP